MATPISLPSVLYFTLLFPFWTTVLAQSEPSDFAFSGFNGSSANLILEEATVIKPSGALRLTNKSHNVIGHAFFAKPLLMLNTSSIAATKVSSFSTYFVFQIVPAGDSGGGFGLAFTLSPSPKFEGGQGEHFLGVLNSSNNGNTSNHIFMVEFDTVNGFGENSDAFGNHVGININSMNSVAVEPASYYKNGSNRKEDLDLEKEPVQAWIDYDGANKLLNVTVSPLRVSKPSRPLMSENIDLSRVTKEKMYAGFSAATGQKSSAHYVLGWSFRLNGIADSLDISRLPVLPVESESSSFNPRLREALIVVFSLVLFF